MKNVQVIDASDDCPYNIYAVTEDVFGSIFDDGTSVQFLESLTEQIGEEKTKAIVDLIEAGKIARDEVRGIHGLLFFGLIERSIYFPTRRFDQVGHGS